jgi:hypothetical protein
MVPNAVGEDLRVAEVPLQLAVDEFRIASRLLVVAPRSGERAAHPIDGHVQVFGKGLHLQSRA